MSVATRPEAQNLEAARARLQRLGGPMLEALAASGQALAVSDAADPERPIVFANRAFEALTGYAEGEILGSSWAVLEAPGAVQDIEAAGAATCDRPCRRRDGSIFWGRISLSVLRDEDGAPLFHLATLADVSAEHVPAADLLQITRRRLVQAQEQLHAARVAAGAAGAWEWDIPAARLTGDARFANLQGLDPVETAAGLPTNAFFRSVHPDDRLRLRIAVAGALNGAEVFARDFRLLVDGEERWVSARGRTYLDGEDRPLRFSGVLADITDQKRLEERLKIAQSAGGIGAFEYVVGFGTVEVFGQFCELLGLRPATSLPVRTINGLVVPGDPAIIQEAEESQPIGASYQEFRIRRADTGEERWLAARGEHRPGLGGGVRYIGALYDITASKEAEAKLRTLTNALEARVEVRTQERDRIWNVSQDLLFVADRRGRHTAVNPAWADLLGFTESELVGSPVHALVHEDDLAVMRRRLADTKGATSGEFDCRMRTREGDFRWISWTLIVADHQLFGSGRDITQRRHLEDQLRQSQKMEAVGQLTGGLAHDFNNMLTGIIGGLDLVRRRISDGRVHDVDRFLDAAGQSAQRAAALTHRLLAFSRRQTLDSRPVEVAGLVRSMEDMLRRTLGEQVALSIEAPPSLPMAVADANQLESAVLNLAINARDAMPGGGRLRVALRALELSAGDLADSDGAEPGRYVEIAVSDTGSGMSPDVQAKVFDPFFTTKPLGQGTGLGLSMIYGFVQQSRGHIHLESREGEGTTFRLYLPLAAVDAAGAEAGGDEQAAPAGQGETVLVIEDDPAVRLLVLQVLSELGYQAIETADGRQAIPVLQSDRALDLVVTDVGLPGLNGRQLAEIARERRPDLPILFMTGYAGQAADQARFLEPGMELISKPFDIAQLSQRIRAILERQAQGAAATKS